MIHVNRIAFVSPSGQLGTVAPDGRDLRSLPQTGRYYQFPAWSPDGRLLAAIGNEPGSGGVYVFAAAAGAEPPTALFRSASERPFYLYWSPDGRTISFLATHPQEEMALHLASRVDGSTRILTAGRPCFWQWSPTSDRLLVHRGSGAGELLAFLDPVGDDRAPNLATPGTFQSPGIAPSGRAWCFSEQDPEGNSRLVIEGPSISRVVVPHEGAAALSWSPARDQLAFSAPPIPARNWYGALRLAYPGSETVRLLVDEVVLAFFWAPDGRSIAYLTLTDPPRRSATASPSRASGNGVYLNGTGPRRTAAPQPSALGLSLGLVDVATGRRRTLTSFQTTDLFLGQFLPFFDQYAHSHHIWAPDSSALVLPVVESGRARVTVVPVDGGQPGAVADGIVAFWSPR